MSFSELPDNILVKIALATNSQRDINALSRASRRIHDVLLLPLYTVNFRQHQCSAVFYLSARGQENALLQLLRLVPQMPDDAQGGWPAAMDGFLLHPKAVSRMDRTLDSPLVYAAWNGHAGTVRILLDHNFNPNYPAVRYHRTPVAIAAQNGHVAVLQTLLTYGANMFERRQGVNTGTPLIDAIECCQAGTLRFLLDEYKRSLGPASFLMAKLSREAFEIAVTGDRVEALPLLMETVGSVDSYLPCKKTGLMLAAENGHVRTTQFLLDAGADPNLITGHEGYTPLTLAAIKGHARATLQLLAAGADLEHTHEIKSAMGKSKKASSELHVSPAAILLAQYRQPLATSGSVGPVAAPPFVHLLTGLEFACPASSAVKRRD